MKDILNQLVSQKMDNRSNTLLICEVDNHIVFIQKNIPNYYFSSPGLKV